MTFKFYAKFGALKGYETERVFERGIKAKWSFEKLKKECKRGGMSYRKKDMLYDYRRSKATFYAKTMTSRIDSLTFFDNFYEPTRDRHKWSSSETTDFFRQGRLGMLKTEDELVEYEAIMDEVAKEYPEKYG